jgi:hypothetical protein
MAEKLGVGAIGSEVAQLHGDLARRGLEVPATEVSRQFFGPGTRDAVLRCQRELGAACTGEVDNPTSAVLAGSQKVETTGTTVSAVNPRALVPGPTRDAPSRPAPAPSPSPAPSSPTGNATAQIGGRIFTDEGGLAGQVTVRVYSRGFGGATALLGETKTDPQGAYSVSYAPSAQSSNLEIRAVDASGAEIPLSETKFSAGPNEVANLVAPSSIVKLAPEYGRLATDLVTQVGNLTALAAAKETEDQPDLSVLSQATGWDARLIAVASQASRLSADTGITHDALYALLRSGLPADAQQLALVGPDAVQLALSKAVDAGIVALDGSQTAAAIGAYKTFARATLMTMKAPGAASSFGDLLSAVGSAAAATLTEAEKATFADIYLSHRGAPAELWQKVRNGGISEAKISALRVQGKLAHLTHNNAALIAQLASTVTSPETLPKLLDRDLHKPDSWNPLIQAASGNDVAKLAQLIPPAYMGDTTEERAAAYADDLARKVRLNFPTEVAARMIEQDELTLGPKHAYVKQPVQALMRNASNLGFTLGATPVSSFLVSHADTIFKGMAPADAQSASDALKDLHRLHQITPSDGALSVLSKLGFKSAHDVTAFSLDGFLTHYGDLFTSRDEARLVYRKSQQVSDVTYTFYAAARHIDTSPAVPVLSPPAAVRQQAQNALIKHYPTLESLFGSLDYCQCEECRSVLGPAAYLVDLLQFLDPDPLVWDAFLRNWERNHNGESYTTTYSRPYDALIERRPDLPNLALTCENTNTALPYIDLSNEILEYYIANGKLDDQLHYDTGSATTPELLAEPQNIISTAYETLLEERYPLNLPFDLWIETARQFFQQFDTPLWQMLDLFRRTEELQPPTGANAFGRAAVYAEALSISPAEYALLTDLDPLAHWYELYGFSKEADALSKAVDGSGQRIDLNSAKALSRRLGISYADLVALLDTQFINPRLDSLVTLRALGVDVSAVYSYKNQSGYPPMSATDSAAFEQRLDEFSQKYAASGFNARTWLDATFQRGDFATVLLLADLDSTCDFSNTTIQYAGGNSVDPIALLKVNLFVRLQRKLGWTTEETDRALAVFVPTGSLPLTGKTIGPALRVALLYTAHLSELAQKVNAGANARLKLLTLWSNLSTTGKTPLYSQLFLTPSVLKNDQVFDDPLGAYLSKPGVPLQDHLHAIQGALGLAADEVIAILADAGETFAGAFLTLDTVSLLYRYRLLGRALKLSVREIIALKAMSGLNPFQALKTDAPTTVLDDYPLTKTLAFVEIAAIVRSSGFAIDDLKYLLRHQFDPVGKYREGAPLVTGRALAAGIRRIRADNAMPADPSSLTDDVLRQKLPLVLPQSAADTLLAMWTGTAEFEASQPGILPASKLDPATFASEPDIRVTYDPVRQVQRLAVRGVLFDARKMQLKAAFPTPLVGTLLDSVQAQARMFGQTVLGPFLTSADFDFIFAPVDGTTDADRQQSLAQKRARLAQGFLPFLQRTLTQQLVVQTVAASTAADPSLVQEFVTDTELLQDPSKPGSSLLDAFSGIADSGVRVRFFTSTDGTGDAVVDLVLGGATTAGRPAGTRSARFDGHIEVPTTGTYRFSAAIDARNVEGELQIDGLEGAVFSGMAAQDNAEISGTADLKAGQPYLFRLDVRNLSAGDVTLSIQGDTLRKSTLDSLTLYVPTAVERYARANILVSKVVQLLRVLALDPDELRYMLAHATDFDNLNLSALPTRSADDTIAGATVLFRPFLRLAGYAALKRDLSPDTNDLLEVLDASRKLYSPATDVDGTTTAHFQRLADLTRRDAIEVRSTADALGLTVTSTQNADGIRIEAPFLADERGIARIWKALQMTASLGVPATALGRWTAVVSPTATAADRFAIARDLRNTFKARYEQDDWLRIAQPVFDILRGRSRDALSACVMRRNGFERLDQLFEYFLIDPLMEPVVQTSRLRLAISSVQLFIQRCLLNLEPKVHPSSINANHWQWMKRYRVWEANRKIFLYPENWLEPEFRDDKTYLYRELEGALLQGDVSNDLAEDAFFKYLKRLEEIARLEVVTMYCEEKPLDPASNALHVLGRTHSLPHKYFYRRMQNRVWTPWEPVSAEIESDHIVLVVWRQRVQLFWLTFLDKPKPSTQSVSNTIGDSTVNELHFDTLLSAMDPGSTIRRDIDVQLNWSEYYQGEWTTRAAGGFGNPISATVKASFDTSQIQVHVSKEPEEDGIEGAVLVHMHFTEALQ